MLSRKTIKNYNIFTFNCKCYFVIAYAFIVLPLIVNCSRVYVCVYMCRQLVWFRSAA